jgi:RNA polymerase sigma-70 factor (ECF subfamily)
VAKKDFHTKADEELMLDCIKGDMEAFNILFDRYRRPIFAYVYQLIGDYGDVEGVTQEAFVRVFKYLDTYEYPKKFSTWFYTIVRNLCIDRIKKIQKERDNVISDFIVYGRNTKSEFLKLLPDDTLTPQEIAHRNQRIQAVRDAIDELDPIYKEVITLFVLQKLPYNEIAEILDVPSGTLRSRVHHGLKKLRSIMKRKGINF